MEIDKQTLNLRINDNDNSVDVHMCFTVQDQDIKIFNLQLADKSSETSMLDIELSLSEINANVSLYDARELGLEPLSLRSIIDWDWHIGGNLSLLLDPLLVDIAKRLPKLIFLIDAEHKQQEANALVTKLTADCLIDAIQEKNANSILSLLGSIGQTNVTLESVLKELHSTFKV